MSNKIEGVTGDAAALALAEEINTLVRERSVNVYTTAYRINELGKILSAVKQSAKQINQFLLEHTTLGKSQIADYQNLWDVCQVLEIQSLEKSCIGLNTLKPLSCKGLKKNPELQISCYERAIEIAGDKNLTSKQVKKAVDEKVPGKKTKEKECPGCKVLMTRVEELEAEISRLNSGVIDITPTEPKASTKKTVSRSKPLHVGAVFGHVIVVGPAEAVKKKGASLVRCYFCGGDEIRQNQLLHSTSKACDSCASESGYEPPTKNTVKEANK